MMENMESQEYWQQYYWKYNMTQRQKQRQSRLSNKITKKGRDITLTNNPQFDNMSLNHDQLLPIINQLRLLAGSVHSQQTTNLSKAFFLYFSDITSRISELNAMILKEQSVIKGKDNEISQLKLLLKGSKNDFAEMKSSLILEMEEQRTVAEHLKQEIRLQRERLSNTVRQLMEQARCKDQQMAKLRQQSEEELKKARRKTSNIAKNDEFEQSRKRVNTVYDRQKVQLFKSQERKKQQQRQQFMNLLKELKIDTKKEDSQEIITYVEGLNSKIRQLQLNLLERQQQIDTQQSFSYLTTSKTVQNGMLLTRKQEEIDQLKQKIVKLYRAVDGKQTQITQLRGIIQKYLREKEENNKYLGTKWQHEIERVMLNAEVEFDREKNRIKRAGEERLAEVERVMGDKIQQLREENRNIRENKLKKAIQRVRELENAVKELEQDKVIEAENHKHQVDQLKKTINNMNQEHQHLSGFHKLALNNYEQEKLKSKEISHELGYLKLTLRQKQMQLQSQNKKKLDIQKVEMEAQKSTFITTSKNTYEQIVKKFQQQQRVRQKQQQEKFRTKYQQLFVQVNKTKKEHEDLCQAKIKQVNDEKDDLKRTYEKLMRAAKQEERSRQEELGKIKTKFTTQVKQLKDQINKKEEELLKNKQQIEALSKDKKNKDHTIRNKGDQICSLSQQIKTKQLHYNQLQSLYHSLSGQHQQLQMKYSNISDQILQLKHYFLKQHAALKQQHLKTQRNYRAYIKDIEEACFSSSDRNIYVREIRRLKLMNDGAETDLKNAQNKLLTMKQLSKYQSNKIQRLEITEKQKQRQQYTYRSEQKLKLDYRSRLNFTERRGTDKQTIVKEEIKSYRQDRNNSTASLYRLYDRDMDASRQIQKDKEKSKEKEPNNSTRYLKLSKIKAKTKNHFYQQNRFKKSKVGLSHIDNYTDFEKERDNFRMLTSPRHLSSYRAQTEK